MRIEDSMYAAGQNGPSTACTPIKHDLEPSDGAAKLLPILGATPTTLGSSDLSFVRSVKTSAVALALASTVTFTNDPAIGQSLVRERLPVMTRLRDPVLTSASSRIEPAVAGALGALLAAVDAEPVEDGVIHPAEQQVSSFVRQHGVEALYAAPFADALENPGRMAALVRLLGRLSGIDAESRARLLRASLESPNIEVRDAAVQAAELWEDQGSIAVLKAHRETTPWLADYVARVVRDLES